jgi:hypothetical protein
MTSLDRAWLRCSSYTGAPDESHAIGLKSLLCRSVALSPPEMIIMIAAPLLFMTWLLGVRHDDKHLEDVLRRLGKEELAGKKVMVEMFSYPMTDDLRKMNSHFANQWDGIAGYVLERKGQLVFGEDKNLFYGAQDSMDNILKRINDEREPVREVRRRIDELEQEYHHKGMMCGVYHSKMNELLEQKDVEEKKIDEKVKELRKQYDEASLTERQPHFAKVVAQEKPDIIILATAHMPYLFKNCFHDCDYHLTCIPSEGLGHFYESFRKICNIEDFDMSVHISVNRR